MLNTQDKLKSRFKESGVFSSTEVAITSLDEKMMHKTMEIVEKNLSNEFFGIPEFCEELGMSRTILFTKIKAWTGQTPNEFIMGMRMKKAAELIEQNKHRISRIGYMVGFKDANYFSKCFKKYFSLSPKAYAEKFGERFYID